MVLGTHSSDELEVTHSCLSRKYKSEIEQKCIEKQKTETTNSSVETKNRQYEQRFAQVQINDHGTTRKPILLWRTAVKVCSPPLNVLKFLIYILIYIKNNYCYLVSLTSRKNICKYERITCDRSKSVDDGCYKIICSFNHCEV